MRDFYLPGKLCLRVFSRANWLWPYFSRRYTVATFGAGYWGIMLMRTMTRPEVEEFNRRRLCGAEPSTEGTDQP